MKRAQKKKKPPWNKGAKLLQSWMDGRIKLWRYPTVIRGLHVTREGSAYEVRIDGQAITEFRTSTEGDSVLEMAKAFAVGMSAGFHRGHREALYGKEAR